MIRVRRRRRIRGRGYPNWETSEYGGYRRARRSKTPVVAAVAGIVSVGVVVAATLGSGHLFNVNNTAAAAAVNPNCTLIVPANPLTAAGLATPYQLTATDPAAGPCNEANAGQTAFVQGRSSTRPPGRSPSTTRWSSTPGRSRPSRRPRPPCRRAPSSGSGSASTAPPCPSRARTRWAAAARHRHHGHRPSDDPGGDHPGGDHPGDAPRRPLPSRLRAPRPPLPSRLRAPATEPLRSRPRARSPTVAGRDGTPPR